MPNLFSSKTYNQFDKAVEQKANIIEKMYGICIFKHIGKTIKKDVIFI